MAALAAANAELLMLQSQIKVANSERDRNAFEKLDAVAKSAAAAKERDELRARLDEVTSQRDAILAERESTTQQVEEAAKQVADANWRAEEAEKKAQESDHRAQAASARADTTARELDEARRQAAEAAAEHARYRHEIENAPAEDPWAMLWRALSQLTQDGVAWTRAKIPADSPILPWFDKAVAGATRAGCVAIKTADAAIKWATPHAIALFERAKSEIAQRMEKK